MKTSIDADKEVGVDVNTDKSKCVLLCRHHSAGQSRDIKIGNRCFENKCTVQIFGNGYNKSKPDSGGN
jgi:hypothetical protein